MNDLLGWLQFYLTQFNKVFGYNGYTLEYQATFKDTSYMLSCDEDGFIVAITDTLGEMQAELERIAPLETWLASEVIRP